MNSGKYILPWILIFVVLSFCSCSCKHSEVYDVNVDATCSELGKHEVVCKKCNTIITSTSVPMKEHTYTETQSAPTCSSDGYITYICSECGNTETKITDEARPAHDMQETRCVESTCAKKGLIEKKCVNCSATETVETELKEHCYTVISQTEATCREKAKTVYQCSVCEHEKVEEGTEFAEHTYQVQAVKKATCTADEATTYRCSVCGDEKVVVTGSARGHSYKWKTVKNATQTEEGTEEGICTVCGNTTSRAIKKLTAQSIDQLLDSASLQPQKTGYKPLDDIVGSLLNTLLVNKKTTSEKVRACYNYLIADYSYGWEFSNKHDGFLFGSPYNSDNEGYWVYAASEFFECKSGTCNGFSAAFAVMMRRIGLECFPVGCKAKAGNNYSGHVLTMMNIGGVNYVFDPQIEQVLANRYGKLYYSRYGKTPGALGDAYKDYDDLSYCRNDFGKFEYNKDQMDYLYDAYLYACSG